MRIMTPLLSYGRRGCYDELFPLLQAKLGLLSPAKLVSPQKPRYVQLLLLDLLPAVQRETVPLQGQFHAS